MKRATLYRVQIIRQTNGYERKVESQEDITPEKYLTYEQMIEAVGGLVEMVPLPNGDTMICNEEGKLTGLPKNEAATQQWKLHYPIEHYPENNDELVVGNAVFCTQDCLEQ